VNIVQVKSVTAIDSPKPFIAACLGWDAQNKLSQK
jgi:hypothetical protein